MNKKILIVSPVPTHPPFAGNRSCILSYSIYMESLGHKVFFMYIYDKACPEAENLLKEYWKDRLIIYRPFLYEMQRRIYRMYRILTKGKPCYNVDDWYPPGLGAKVQQIQKIHKFHIIWVNYIWLSKLFTKVNHAVKVLDTHDVFTFNFEKTGSKWFSTTPNEEAKALGRADYVVAIQEEEGIFLEKLTTKRTIVAFKYFPIKRIGLQPNNNILFFSSENEYNLTAIDWFIKNVFKKLVKKYPDVRLLIGGSICSKIENSDSSITLLGKFEDVEFFYKRGNLVINPVSQGTGLKIKTFEALSFGKVLITHPHNIIGVPFRDQIPVFVADNAEDYINHISNLIDHYAIVDDVRKKVYDYMEDYNKLVKDRMAIILDN